MKILIENSETLYFYTNRTLIINTRVLTTEFLQELKVAFDKEMAIKTSLDTKSNNLVSVSGTVATLFMGFGSFLLKDIPTTKSDIIIPGFIILITEIILTTLAIKYAITAYKLRDYYYPITYNIFFNSDGKHYTEMINRFVSAPTEDFCQRLILDYLTGVRLNTIQNQDKARKIDYAQRFFLIALIMVPVFAFIITLSKFL